MREPLVKLDGKIYKFSEVSRDILVMIALGAARYIPDPDGYSGDVNIEMAIAEAMLKGQ